LDKRKELQEASRDLLTNRDIALAQARAIEARLRKYAEQLPRLPREKLRLLAIASAAERWWFRAVSDPFCEELTKLRDDQIISELTPYLSGKDHLILDNAAWTQLLHEADANTPGEPKLSAAMVEYFAGHLAGSFTHDFVEVLKSDLQTGGKAYAAVSLRFFGEILSAIRISEANQEELKPILEQLPELLKQTRDAVTALRTAGLPPYLDAALAATGRAIDAIVTLSHEMHERFDRVDKAMNEFRIRLAAPGIKPSDLSHGELKQEPALRAPRLNARGGLTSVWHFDSTVEANKNHPLRNEQTRSFLQQQYAGGPLPAPFHLDDWKEWLISIYQSEVARSLAETRTLSSVGLQQKRSQAEHHPSFVQMAGNNQLVSEVELRLTASSRLGLTSNDNLLRKHLALAPKLCFAVSPAHAGSIAILYYLTFVKHYPIDVAFRFPHSVEIVKHAVNDSFPIPVHCLTLTLATAAFLLKNSCTPAYVPHMILPEMSHGVIAPGDGDPSPDLNSGCYLFMGDPPSSESFLFDDMARYGNIARTHVGYENMEPDDTTLTLKAGGTGIKAIIGFPHYCLQGALNGCRMLNDPRDALASREVILFMQKTFLADRCLAEAISVAIRNAWLSLREQPSIRHSIVRLFLENRDYVRLVTRCAGLHHLQLDMC
jgi:hypothetical protein